MRSLLLALLLGAGCLGPPAASDAEFRLHGTFTEEATPDDIAEAGRIVRAEGGDMAVLESFPPQFSATGIGPDACERIRAAFLEKDYFRSVGECEPVTRSVEPDQPVSN